MSSISLSTSLRDFFTVFFARYQKSIVRQRQHQRHHIFFDIFSRCYSKRSAGGRDDRLLQISMIIDDGRYKAKNLDRMLLKALHPFGSTNKVCSVLVPPPRQSQAKSRYFVAPHLTPLPSPNANPSLSDLMLTTHAWIMNEGCSITQHLQ